MSNTSWIYNIFQYKFELAIGKCEINTILIIVAWLQPTNYKCTEENVEYCRERNVDDILLSLLNLNHHQ